MHVAGSHDRLFQPVGYFNYFKIEVYKLLLAAHRSVAQHEHVVAYGLYLKVIVKLGKAHYLLVGALFDHRAEYLALLAGAAYYKPLSVLFQNAFGDKRLCRSRLSGIFLIEGLFIVFEMRE